MAEETTTVPALWGYRDVAEYVGVTPRTVRRWVAEEAGPRPTRLGRTVRFRVQDVMAWIDEQAGAAA